MNLKNLGWNDHFEKQFAPFLKQGLIPGRVARQNRDMYQVYGEQGAFLAKVTGKIIYRATGEIDFPAVGDWVVAQINDGQGIIHDILERQSKFSRKMKQDQTAEQIVAANVDIIFLISGLDDDFNLRRIERYLTLSWESGASPVILLNKADICDDLPEKIESLESVAMGVPIHAFSARENKGLDSLTPYLKPGKTIALLGSSGVGKSTIINRLLGEDKFATAAVRESDSHGRHTTTARELVLLPNGGILVDTPGMRELQLWGDLDSVDQSFGEIMNLAEHCRFRDCSHESEPGCAVIKAHEKGDLDSNRYESYLKLKKEMQYLAAKKEQSAQFIEKQKGKKLNVLIKEVKKIKKDRGR